MDKQSDRICLDPSAPPPPEASASRLHPSDGNGAAPSVSQTLETMGRQLKELQDYASYYIAAKTDGIKVTLKSVLVYAALGILGLLAGGAALITLVVLTFRGIAGGLAALFGGRLWLGELLTGVLFLAAVAGAAYYFLGSMKRKSLKATTDKYENRKRKQRRDHGHDVQQRAEEQRLQEAAGKR